MLAPAEVMENFRELAYAISMSILGNPVRGMRHVAAILLLIVTVTACGHAGSLRQFFGMSLYGDREVPALVYDASSLRQFLEGNPDPGPRTRITALPHGEVEPGGDIAPDDYIPEAYGSILRRHLNLRSFPSLMVLPEGRGPVFYAEGWEEIIADATGCALRSSYAVVTYKVVASFDYCGKGLRDWLLVSTQQVGQDPDFVLVLWLLVKNPQPGATLEADIVSLEERRGLALGLAVRQGAEAAGRIAALRAMLGLDAPAAMP